MVIYYDVIVIVWCFYGDFLGKCDLIGKYVIVIFNWKTCNLIGTYCDFIICN